MTGTAMDEVKLNKVKRVLLSMQRYSWEQGTAMQAFLEAGDMDTVICMAYEAANRRIPDGRCAVIGSDGASTDPCSVGEALYSAYKLTGEAKLGEAYKGLLHWALTAAPRSSNGIVYHFENSKEFWSDSMYMLPPFLCSVGEYDEAVKQINGYLDILYDKEKHLMSHRFDDSTRAFVRKEAWGGGNGWTLAGLTRVIAKLPDTMKEQRNHLICIATEILDAVLVYMTDDGKFHDVIDDESTFAERTLAEMIAYTIYRGMADGWLDNSYEPRAEFLYRSVNAGVDSYGFVRDVCGAPVFDSLGLSAEGQAFYILMCSAAEKYFSLK